MPTPIGREVIEGVRRFKGYADQLWQTLSAQFPDVVVGRPYQSWDRGHFEITVYSDMIVNTWYVRDLPEVKAVTDAARNCGTRLALLFEKREMFDYLKTNAFAQA